MVNTLLEIYQPMAEATTRAPPGSWTGSWAAAGGSWPGDPAEAGTVQTQQEIKHEAVDVRAELAALLARVQERAT